LLKTESGDNKKTALIAGLQIFYNRAKSLAKIKQTIKRVKSKQNIHHKVLVI